MTGLLPFGSGWYLHTRTAVAVSGTNCFARPRTPSLNGTRDSPGNTFGHGPSFTGRAAGVGTGVAGVTTAGRFVVVGVAACFPLEQPVRTSASAAPPAAMFRPLASITTSMTLAARIRFRNQSGYSCVGMV